MLGSLFVYISASPFVLIEHFGWTPTYFSYFFASNAVGLMLAGQLGMWLQRRWSEQRILVLGLAWHTAMGLLLVACSLSGAAPLWLYAALLALAIWSLGLVFGNLTALTMAQAGGQAGVASALMGSLQYLLSACVGLALSLVPPGLLPLPLTLVLCGALALRGGGGAVRPFNAGRTAAARS